MNRKIILIAEDDLLLSQLIRNMIMEQFPDHIVETRQTIKGVYVFLAHAVPDCIVLDYFLDQPCEELIREFQEYAQICIITGNPDRVPEDIKARFPCLVKPFNRTELIEQVALLLGKKS